MFQYNSLLLFIFIFIFVLNNCNCFNISDFLTSSYAQVSHSGNNKNNENEARSKSHGQSLWTHSSDASIFRGQNIKHKLASNKKITNDNIGEVILQDRFNPKPFFGYEPSASNINTNINKPNNQNNNNNIQIPFDSFPLTLKPDSTNTKNNYDSMYTSYDPPPALASGPSNENVNFVTYKPPPPSKNNNNNNDMVSNTDTSTSTDDTSDEGPPIFQVFNPPHKHHHHLPKDEPSHEDTNNNSDENNKDEEDINLRYPGLPAYLDHDPNEHHYGHGHGHGHGHGQIYLSNYPGVYPHPHIYHEIKTTTEAQVTEDQRLSKKPYSYYYLGRKLWYIPLYFSVYFIIYIFVLIVKSIARHKITFNHYFEEDKREMKDTMPQDHDHHDHSNIDHLDEHVWSNIHAAKRKYIM